MRQDWILHNSQLPAYRSPFGAVPCGRNILLRLEMGAALQPDTVTVRLWHNVTGESKVDMSLLEQKCTDKKVYQTQFTASDIPGVLWYYFIISTGGKTWYYGNNPASLGGVGVVYTQAPPAYQVTVYKPGLIVPDWYKEGVMYQIFIDRFFNGNEDGRVLNPKKNSVLHAYWDNTPYYIRDVDTKRIVYYDFFGGNLRGVIKKLPYLKELGISVIYFNPLFESPSNHRYDTANYKKIDPMLGDNELFAELCAKAREMGIAVILDGVFSHTGSDSIYFNKEGNYPELGAFQSPESPYYKWYRFSEYPHKYESWWGIDTLPNVEEMEPSYIDYIIEKPDSVIKYWLNQGARGWRLDVVDELPDEFVKKLYKELKDNDPDNILIGEVWEDASHKESYGKLREYLCGEELDSVMNYPFRKILLDFFLGAKDAYGIHCALMSLWENYPREHSYGMMNLIGSHDVPRALTLLGEAPPESQLSIADQAMYRLSPEQRRRGVARLKMMSLWQMTFPGVPCVYYGDEAGLEGYKDPFNRGTYPWGREDAELVAWYKKIIAIRNQYDVLKTGEWLPLYYESDVYAYIRKIQDGHDVFNKPQQDNTVVVIFNRSTTQPADLVLDVRQWCYGLLDDLLNEGHEYRVKGGKLNITLQPLEGKLLLQREKDAFPRQCGILLHPTSLPSKYGIGDLGKEAYEFVNFLRYSHQKLWQILPLNPVGFGESPYQCLSAFAGNHLLISLGKLVQEGLLAAQEVRGHPVFDQQKVDFSGVKAFKETALRKAFAKFASQDKPPEYEEFIAENAIWLENYALFMAVKHHFDGKAWHEWPPDIAFRRQAALTYYQDLLAGEIDFHKFLQFIFAKQWLALKRYARSMGVKIIGDLPIFVSYDSSDVWANTHLFELDACGCPSKVAGVPPDYFCEKGQLWGNPHYKWDEMAKDDYQWWRERIKCLLKSVDIIRVDHFLGFEAYWEIQAGEETAENGCWAKGPGAKFFATLEKYLGKLPIIAEDLGIVTQEVEDLKHQFYFPGMKILQFSFYQDEVGEWRLPPVEKNAAIYTGTHDNDTTCSWYQHLRADNAAMANCISRYLGFDTAPDEREFCWRLLETAYRSNANMAIIPMQDVLCLGNDARMNLPGTIGGNWHWRVLKTVFTPELASRLANLARKYNR